MTGDGKVKRDEGVDRDYRRYDTFVREVEQTSGPPLTIHQHYVGECGAVVWDAALVLCKYIEKMMSSAPNFLLRGGNGRVVELGSGTGTVGLQIARFGGNVTLTDLSSSLSLLKKNTAVNKHLLEGGVNVEALVWGVREHMDAVSKTAIDLLIVCDCLYYEESATSLVQTIRYLCSPSTLILLCYEDREDKRKIQEEFFENAAKVLYVQEVALSEMDAEWRSSDIHIFCMWANMGQGDAPQPLVPSTQDRTTK